MIEREVADKVRRPLPAGCAAAFKYYFRFFGTSHHLMRFKEFHRQKGDFFHLFNGIGSYF